MANLPRIYVFHASDAGEQIERLKKIFLKMKADHRIGDFTFFEDFEELAALPARVKEDDAIITLLTAKLTRVNDIKDILRQLKVSRPKFKVWEVIVDALTYDNRFMSFPQDFKPIRHRVDIEAVWIEIEKRLQNSFPVQQVGGTETDWRTILKYAVPLVVVAIVLWLIFGRDKGPTNNGGVTGIVDGDTVRPIQDTTPEGAEAAMLKAEFTSDKQQCEAPCTVVFTNMSENAERYQWDFGNGETKPDENPTYTFNNAGHFQVKLTAFRNGEQKVVTHPITVSAPLIPTPAPVANFTPSQTECLLPCTVSFTNHSENATSFRWDFGDGTPVTEKDPSHRFTTAGEHRVTLVAINDQQIEVTRTLLITIKGTVPVRAFPFATHGADARKASDGDKEIDSNDWTSVEVSYSLRVVDGRKIELSISWHSQERNENRTRGDTRFRSSKTFPVFNVESCCPGALIDELVGVETSATQEKYYSGKVHDYKAFPNVGSLSGLEVRFDGPEDNDEPRQGLRGTLQAFSVKLKAGN